MNLYIYGLSTSQYSGNLGDLDGVDNSVNKLIPVLRENGDVHWKTNLTSTDAKNDFIEYISNYSNNNESVFIFFYCGHGFLTGNMDSLILGTIDTTDKNYSADVGINCNFIIDSFKKQNISKFIIILDCCHSGLITDMGGNSKNDFLKGVAYLTATEKKSHFAKQVQIEGQEYAAFTFFFAETLKNGINNGGVRFSLSDVKKEIERLISISEYKESLDTPRIKSVNNLCYLPIFQNKGTFILPNSVAVNNTDSSSLKVLLVKTAIDFPIKDYDFGVPLGLWLLKSYIQLQGISVEIEVFDERLLLKQNKSFSFEETMDGFDVVGVSICTCEVPAAIRKLIEAKKKGKITFVGGIFCSSNEKYLLSYKCIDYVIPGVSTIPLFNLLKELLKEKRRGSYEIISHIYGVISKGNVDNLKVWKPSQLPNIELNIWKEIVERYAPYLGGKIDIFTSRGCNQRCDFCSVQKECQQKTYQRDLESIEDEICYLYDQGFRYFSIKDEDFLLYGKDYLWGLLERCSSHLPGITFKLRARVDGMIKEQINLEALYKIGVREIQYGLESPEKEMLSKIKKGYKYGKESLTNLIVATANNGIIANCSFILGIQGETIDYYNGLRQFFSSLDVPSEMLKIYINFLTPHPYKNEFPKGDYCLVTKDLKYFTHKNPVAYPKNMKRVVRIEMLKTYKDIVEKFDISTFNPSFSSLLQKKVEEGEKITNLVLPNYEEDEYGN